MVRKKKPVISGSDPSYSSTFSDFRTLPTHKAPETPEPKPAVTLETSEPAPKPENKAPKRKPAPTPATEKPKPPKQSAPATDLGDKRETALSAAVTVELHNKLVALEGKGIFGKDAITLAGRRAVERFEPKPEFIDKPDAERMPMRQGYKSTKRIAAAMLDKLRDEHDPLRLSSDGAMVRGQFEPLFWSCLDEVIEELNNKY